ncbi:MAG: ECF transporter S component [Oscillospiraceae bacterium]|nr:ECF transporter S component [Oscillospiraceae bacterium]
MKHSKIYEFVLAAMFAALAFAATNIVHIPIPATNGYIHLGDCVVLLGAFLLGPSYGAAAGGIGSALADILSGYALYAPGTFVIKAAVAVVAGLLMHALSHRTKAAPVLAGICGEFIMIFGYFVYESIVLGYGLAATGSIAGNAVQAVAGVILSVLLYVAMIRVPMIKKMAS